MSAHPFRAAALLALAAGSTLLNHSAADARRLDATVIVGRVTSSGRPLQGASVSVAGRGPGTQSAADGRYALTVARSAAQDRITLLARRIGYETWQRAVDLRGDTLRIDIALTPAMAQLEEVVVADQRAAKRVESSAAPGVAEGRRADVTGATASAANQPAPLTQSAPTIMPQTRVRRDVAKAHPGTGYHEIRRPREPGNTEAYERIDENPFRPVSVAPLSTFSVDVDRASYSNVRRFLNQGALPPEDAVRVEELVNYFPYGDAKPARGDVPLRISTELAPAPWNTRHDLLRIALRAREVDMRRAPAANLVFLVDVSGSMRGPSRLPLVKQSP